jgi:hypothetical protein
VEAGTVLLSKLHCAMLTYFRDKGRGVLDLSGTGSDNASGYKLFAIQFDVKTGEPVQKADSQTAAISILSNIDEKKCAHGSFFFRGSKANCITPTGIAFDKKGRLFMASEQTNEIFVITRKDGSSMDTVELDVLEKLRAAEYPIDTKVAAPILKVRGESTWSTLWKMFGTLKV